ILIEADGAVRQGVGRPVPGLAGPGARHRAGDDQSKRLTPGVQETVAVRVLRSLAGAARRTVAAGDAWRRGRVAAGPGVEAAVTVGVLVRAVDHRDLPRDGPARSPHDAHLP